MSIAWGDRTGLDHTTAPSEFIARLRVYENETGALEAFCTLGCVSTASEFGNTELAELLHDRWKDIRVKQLGTDGVVVVEPDEVATMLRLILPDDLHEEIEAKIDPRVWQPIEKALLIERFGSQDAFQRAGAAP